MRRTGRGRRRLDAVAGRWKIDLAAGDHAGRREQPGRGVGQRGLAAAGLARQAEHLAAVQGEVDVAQRVHGSSP